MFTDAHVHIDELPDASARDRFITLAHDGKVGRLFCNTTCQVQWEALSSFAIHNEEIVPFFGVHPWYADSASSNLQEELLQVVSRQQAGIGEIGLDKQRRSVNLYQQRQILSEQIRVAIQLKRPFVLHCVHAWGSFLEVLKELRWNNTPFMAHGFYAPREILYQILDRGGYISFSHRSMLHSYPRIHELIHAVPLDRVLLETDFPFTEGGAERAPVETYPDCVRECYEAFSNLRGIRIEQTEEVIWHNGSVFTNATLTGVR